MSTALKSETDARIQLDDVITSAGQGVLRALEARQRVPQRGEGFFVELLIRCGIPPEVNQSIGVQERAVEGRAAIGSVAKSQQ